MLLLLPLFLCADTIKSRITDDAIAKRLYDSHVWHRLLHVDQSGAPSIKNHSFLISYPDFTPKNELIATIDSFFEDNETACRYPARYYWLKNELNLTDASFPARECRAFDEYIEKTNPKDLKLVFVSEQVKSPSSMMGHTFFKLVGNDSNGEPRQNAVSFFTVIDTFNIPYLILKSTVTGMKGFFILSPYKTQINRYLKEEERNIWEYDLNLSDFQKKLIYYHFWELKDIDITYLFTGFNCATVVDDMLAITHPEYKKDSSLWVTPKDVIKKADAYKLINGSSLIPSKTWELNMLSESIPSDKVETLRHIILDKKYDELKNFEFSPDEKSRELEKLLVLSYTDFLLDGTHDFTEDEARKITLLMDDGNDRYDIDLTKYKNPLKTFNDSQIALSYEKREDKKGVKLTFLPASNTLYDDNREYFGETSLKIGEASLLMERNRITLDTLNLFSMKALIPWNTLTQTLSNDFQLNYEPHYGKDMEAFHAVNLNGGVGLTKKLHEDVFVFALADVGMAYGNHTLYPYAFPQAGLMIYEILNMKSTFEYKYLWNQGNSNEGYHDFDMEQSLFLNKKYRLGISLNRKQSAHARRDTFGFSFAWFF